MNENKSVFIRKACMLRRSTTVNCSVSLLALLLSGCVPRIEVATPTAPITINMNVRVEHDITIRADKDASRLLESNNNTATGEASESRVETTTREQARSETVVNPAAAAAQGR